MTSDTFDLTLGNDEESIGALVALNRGLIIAGYAHVEFMLTDFLIRCSNLIDYGSVLPEKLPYQIEKRLKCLRSILSLPGPFFQYQPEMLPLIDALLNFEDIRHMMSHGLMVLSYNGTDPSLTQIRFRRYDFGPNKTLIHFVSNYTLEEFAKKQHEISKYSHAVVGLMWRVLQETKLPVPPFSIST